jgi:hypothetical protein
LPAQPLTARDARRPFDCNVGLQMGHPVATIFWGWG